MSNPCDTSICTPSKCRDNDCPSLQAYLDEQSLMKAAEEEARRRGANQYVNEGWLSRYINTRHQHQKN
jgi:hypothetical protein